jgi:CBS domain-containing protein
MARPLTAADCMTAGPMTVQAHTSAAEAADLLQEMDIRHLPVLERGALVGILSDRDIRSAMSPGQLDPAEQTRSLALMPVAELMSTDVITVGPETGLAEIISLMVESKVGAIPVVAGDTRRLMGIISYIDVLRAIQELFED